MLLCLSVLFHFIFVLIELNYLLLTLLTVALLHCLMLWSVRKAIVNKMYYYSSVLWTGAENTHNNCFTLVLFYFQWEFPFPPSVLNVSPHEDDFRLNQLDPSENILPSVAEIAIPWPTEWRGRMRTWKGGGGETRVVSHVAASPLSLPALDCGQECPLTPCAYKSPQIESGGQDGAAWDNLLLQKKKWCHC